MRCNHQIRLSPVRLIDENGTQRGVMPTDEALRLASEAGLDLVEVSPNERPPVCKIMDYGKFKYQKSKTKQKHQERKIKEVRLRPKTDEHDKEIKLNRARVFLEHGDRVQFTMLFRGRERFHPDVGMRIFEAIVSEMADVAKVERPARLLGRRMTMVLVPTKSVAESKSKPPRAQQKATNRPGPRKREEGVSAGMAATVRVESPPASMDSPSQPASTAEGST